MRKGAEIEKFEEKEGLRDPPLLEFLDPTLQCSYCFFSSPQDGAQASKFIQVYRMHLKMSWCETECKKNVPLVKQNVIKFEVFILGRQRIDQKRKKGLGRGRRERREQRKETKRELS